MTAIYQSKWRFFTNSELKPAGWLQRQLRIQADGLSGHLADVWPDVRDSAWIGGDREGWERVPYWLDGFVPLAYLLEDEKLIATARRYIDAILAAQREDGWLCPCAEDERARYDVWAVFLICKALMVYGQCSGDARAEDAVYRAMRNLDVHLRAHTLFDWGQSRWFEALIPLQWLYENRPEEWMRALAVTLATQGLSYTRLMDCWRDQAPCARGVWKQQTHIVNLMMALKSEAVFSGLSGDDPNAFAKRMYETLLAHHGSPLGHIQGDECLAGRSPNRGTELCSIVEAMYSCEVLASVTGDGAWLDLLETLAFNALPATVSSDMWTHQYDQTLNQISCAIQSEPPVFGTNRPDANTFGLEPDFGCCTANFSQGFPKLALTAFLRTERGVLSAALVPSVLTSEIAGERVKISLDTEYPFRGALVYTVSCARPVAFELAVRIPGYARSAVVDGAPATPGTVYRIQKTWCGEEIVRVALTFDARLVPAENGMACLRYGALFFALPIAARAVTHEYERNGVLRKFPYCDYEFFPDAPWGYAFAGEDFKVLERPVGDAPFSREQPPVQIEADMARVDWRAMPGQPGVCEDMPRECTPLSHEKRLLSPYGATTLRMTVMPVPFTEASAAIISGKNN